MKNLIKLTLSGKKSDIIQGTVKEGWTNQGLKYVVSFRSLDKYFLNS